MKSLLRLLATFALLVAGMAPLTAASHGSEARSEHQRVVEFWTPERVAQAVPRDFVLDPVSGRIIPSRGKPPGTPGGGGGGDDEASSLVTGESWNGNGEIDGTTGKVLFQMDGSYWICSASVIEDGDRDSDGSAMVLTAAHCVFDETNNEFATMWMFIPDYDHSPAPLDTQGAFCDSTLHGCWSADVAGVHNGYASESTFGAAVAYDFAVVRVGPGGKTADAELDSLVGEQPYSFYGPVAIDSSISGYAFGYPAEKKWKGNDLIYCAGPIDGDPLNADATYRLNECKLNGGSSGGPWLAPFDAGSGSGTVISVNSYGYQGISAMHGPFLNGDTQAVYEAVRQANSGDELIVGG